jgi:hypothetical protein
MRTADTRPRLEDLTLAKSGSASISIVTLPRAPTPPLAVTPVELRRDQVDRRTSQREAQGVRSASTIWHAEISHKGSEMKRVEDRTDVLLLPVVNEAKQMKLDGAAHSTVRGRGVPRQSTHLVRR